MKAYLSRKNINNEFIPVLAEDDTIPTYGKEKLIKTTLEKCKNALQSEMQNIMIEQITNNIEYNLNKENERIKKEIEKLAINDFNRDFKNLLKDKGFILYIGNIFFKYLNYFYDKKNIIPKESMILFFESDFISTIINTYSLYKKCIINYLEPIIDEKSKEFIDMQVKMEKTYGNMSIGNKRDLTEFKEITKIFLNNNYNYFVQIHIIKFLIQQNNRHFNNFLSSFIEEYKKRIQFLLNNNNNDPNENMIKKHLIICIKKKLNSFSEFNGLEISENEFPQISYNPKEIRIIDDILENYFENQNSIILYKNKNVNYNRIQEKKISKNWFNFENNNWKLLLEELKGKIKYFLKNIIYIKYHLLT